MVRLTIREKYDIISMLSASVREDEKGIKELHNTESIIIVSERIRSRKETIEKIKESIKKLL